MKRLRELLEQKIKYERELVRTQFALLETARKLQAAEYERRLTVLNHAHEAALQAQAMTVPREMFSGYVKDQEAWKVDFNKWRDTINIGMRDVTSLSVRISDYEQFKLATSTTLQSIATRSVTWMAAIGLFFILIGIILRFFKI